VPSCHDSTQSFPVSKPWSVPVRNNQKQVETTFHALQRVFKVPHQSNLEFMSNENVDSIGVIVSAAVCNEKCPGTLNSHPLPMTADKMKGR